ncbi:hypothetical protein GXP70_14160 [Paenibacillus lycopersici]|uniref:Uncharacterized protein n=1 Tax=Paenibacillus lycopersici TaxID=2704462 RepID=A0A6C0FV11_9BACL|nr:hypothetical protein [Paenibacillus lycopersici]QHT60978.1 hypothetical protein GXP70_14160 [Paenibacillus lycopersici]
MFAPFKEVSDVTDCPSPDILSVCSSKSAMFAAAFGKGIFRKSGEEHWQPAEQGLPEGVTVNRLQEINGSMFICTNKGLFYYDANAWYPTDITCPCYQVVQRGPILAAATEYGIWYKVGTHWKRIAAPNLPIYDLLLTPHYYILGTNQGISLYDQYTDSWADFALGTSVTSIAVHHGQLVGASMEGELLQGNQQGGFVRCGFPDMTVYALKPTESGVYACTSRGLYRLQQLGARMILRSMLAGYPVTDMCSSADCMYVSTLNSGLKKIVL